MSNLLFYQRENRKVAQNKMQKVEKCTLKNNIKI